MKQFISVILLYSLLIFSSQLLAADSAEKKVLTKKNIAVMTFRTNNCPSSLGQALTDLLAGKIFNSKHFTLLEQSRVENLLVQQKIKQSDEIKDNQAARLGEMLQVEKIVIGSISKFDNYVIEVRIIDVRTRQVDFSVSKESDNFTKLKDIVQNVYLKIDNYYSGYKAFSGDYDLSLAPGYIYARGDFTEGVTHGFGLIFQYTNNKLRLFQLNLSAGFFSLVPDEDYIDSFYLFPLIINFSYVYRISDTINFIPALGAGYLLSLVNHDDYKYKIYGDYQYKQEFFYNPLISVKTEFNFKLYHGYYLACVPYYIHYFESERSNQLFGLDLGVRILF